MTTDVVFLIPADQPTAQDFIGPWEVFCRWMDVRRHVVSSTKGRLVCDTGVVIEATESLDEVSHADIIVVPGTSKPFEAIRDKAAVDWLRKVAPGATWITSVCTGAGVLAAAGLLTGKKATTHWAFRDDLASMGVDVVTDRVVFADNVVTGAGIMAGVDMALELSLRQLGREMTEAIQLSLEYDPCPPTDSGSLEKASPAVRKFVGDMFQAMVDAARPADWAGPGEVRG